MQNDHALDKDLKLPKWSLPLRRFAGCSARISRFFGGNTGFLRGMAWSCPTAMKDMAEIPEIIQYSGWDGIIMEGVHHAIIQFDSTFVHSYALYSQYPEPIQIR